MKEEINRDCYCSTAGVSDCPEKGNCVGCPDYHRKWPTPEQFKEEYGEEYPDKGLVYWKWNKGIVWKCDFYNDIKDNIRKLCIIVCACTPWGKPPNDWRPE